MIVTKLQVRKRRHLFDHFETLELFLFFDENGDACVEFSLYKVIEILKKEASLISLIHP